jgi:HAE1 family hydrophobic/amphiphilic exporter-1
MRSEGMEPRFAIRESVRTRVRPIFMSTLTTLLGMLPLVVPMPSFANGQLEFVAGAGTELYRGLGSVVLGGLLVSTLFTLILVPVGFSLAIELRQFVIGLFTWTDRSKPAKQPVGEALPD